MQSVLTGNQHVCSFIACACSQACCTTVCSVCVLLQTNLTWLDLSFNRITALESLEQLTKLQDLSLYNNQIPVLKGLDTLKDLNVLSIGEQQ